jgi:hypothetical protein
LIEDPNYLRSDCSTPALKAEIPRERLIEMHKEFRKEIK